MTITVDAPSGVINTADAGTTTASFTVRATISSVTLVPGRNRPSVLGASTHTSTVVLLGSSAGLTSVTLPATSMSPGAFMVAASPGLSCTAWSCGICALAITDDVSITVSKGAPGGGVSPGYVGRSVTTPLIGLRISE